MLWKDIETAPKDREIVAWCDHSANPYFAGDNCLTTYGAHAEGLSRADDGLQIVVWGGELDDSDGYIPAWWFLKGFDFEVVANPMHWLDTEAPPVPDALNEWLANGDRGISSEAIVSHLTNIDIVGRWCKRHPCDPADLGRCRKLLEAVPLLRLRLGEMRDVSPVWAALVDQWDELCELMDSEAPEWRQGKGSARETYDRMTAIGC